MLEIFSTLCKLRLERGFGTPIVVADETDDVGGVMPPTECRLASNCSKLFTALDDAHD